MDSFSAQAGESSASGKSKRGGKRKLNVASEDKIIGLISSVCEEMNKRLSELSARLQTKLMQKSNVLPFMRHLKKIPNLTTDERVVVMRYICKNVDELDLFFSLYDDAKCSLVQQILTG
ncbi:Unknown protein [Striga hermonthica]|uniref:Uncharacterized protein n=1 Tax=Striga hermonthica TaxID=68872 RepID=A0A9N7N8C2_STRHE|nr:Unknown protein [Striga hermonthica]